MSALFASAECCRRRGPLVVSADRRHAPSSSAVDPCESGTRSASCSSRSAGGPWRPCPRGCSSPAARSRSSRRAPVAWGGAGLFDQRGGKPGASNERMVATVVLGGEDMNGIAVGARATRWARGCSHPASDASGPGAIRAMSSLGVNAAPAGCLTRDSEPAARPGEELVPVPTREPPERTGCRPPARVRPVVAARVRADSGVHALAGPSSGGRASQCPRRTMRRGTGRIRPPVPDGERRAPGFRHPGTALPRRPRRAVWLGGRLRAAESRRREIQPPLAPANTEAVGGVISAVELLRTLPDHLPGTLAVRACGGPPRYWCNVRRRPSVRAGRRAPGSRPTSADELGR